MIREKTPRSLRDDPWFQALPGGHQERFVAEYRKTLQGQRDEFVDALADFGKALLPAWIRKRRWPA